MVQVDDKRMVNLFQDLGFLEHVVQLVAQNQVFLVLGFHGIDGVLIALAHREDLSEGAIADFF